MAGLALMLGLDLDEYKTHSVVRGKNSRFSWT